MVDDFFSINESFDYILQQFGENVKINGIDKSVIIHRNNYRAIEELKILSYDPISMGDLIQFKNNEYLVNDDTRNMRYNTYYRAVAQRCNYNVNFVINSVVFTQNTVIKNQVTGLDEHEIIVPANQILITVQANSFTNQIKTDDIFIKFKHRWKVIGVDCTKDGILTIYANQDATSEQDDLINEIPAGAGTYNPVITVTPNPVNVNVNSTAQINATVTINGDEVENPILTYTSSDNNICEVDETGLITGISEGNTNVTVSYVGIDNNTYSTTVEIVVEAEAPDRVEIALTDENEDNFNVYPSISNRVFAKLLINGIEDTTATFTFSIKNDEEGLPYETVILSNITSNSVQIEPNKYHQYGTCTLTVILQRDNTITKEQIITMSKLT